MIVLTADSMKTVGEMAFHEDKDKLDIAVNEAVLFDMPILFGNYWSVIEEKWLSQKSDWVNLIDGSDFICGNSNRSHRGVREVLKYYVYARYIVLNGFNDTPSGHVTKTNPFSIPKSLKDLEHFALKYRNMGKQLFEDTEAYLCVNKDFYQGFIGDCESCGCFDHTERRNPTGFGIRTKTIRKWNG